MKGDRRFEFMARRDDWNFGVSLYAREVIEGISMSIAKPMEFTEYDISSAIAAEPFARIGIQEAQNLMDELWQCGLRPSEGTGSAGSLRATERHLEDMRKLVFKGK